MDQEKKPSIGAVMRTELSEVTLKSNCCRRAMLSGLLLCSTCGESGISALYNEESGAELAGHLLRQCFSANAEISPERRGAHKMWRLQTDSKKAMQLLSRISSAHTLKEAIPSLCAGCVQHFLQGVFICCGTLSSPEKSYHLEVILPDERAAALTEDSFSQLGVEPKRAKRPKGIGLYIKDSAVIEEFLAALGTSTTVFDFINAKIVREIRNHENRVANCDAGNIQKSVSATRKQLDAIALLRRLGRMDRLDDELRRTAELREEHEELSLGELGL
ncbi:MAG: DNA-binding protein WhiA, partial [Clostridia bacterium]|nr:DNA-binding protein WhiA [Clostridia bacterium]